MEILTGLIILFAGVCVGWHFRSMIFLHSISENPDKIMEMLKKIKEINENTERGLPEDVIEVTAEQVNGVVYAYAKDTGEFLAQAGNLHQALVLAAKRFPDRKFWHPDLRKDSQTA